MKDENKTPVPESFYQTGNPDTGTSYRGLYITLIVVVILLVGVVSVMGLLNIQLFRRVQELSPEDYVFQVARIADPEPTRETAPARQDLGDSLQINLANAPTAVANIPQEGGLSLQDIYKNNIDSVVTVSTENGSCSGIVISSCGYILTNCHILDGSQTVRVLFHDGTALTARIVGTDAVTDLAVLDVEANQLTPVSFGHDEHLQVGDFVVAIGNPLGATLPGTMVSGYIAAFNRNLEVEGRTMHLLQTSVPLYTGNAGGPLLNCYGQVIGIHVSYATKMGVDEIGFAIPSSTVKQVVDQLLRQGYMSGRPSLGFRVETVSAFDQLYYKVPAGLFITDLSQSKLPLLPGDILLRFAGYRVGDTETLQQYLQQFEAGDTVSIVIYRNGQQEELSLVLEEEK